MRGDGDAAASSSKNARGFESRQRIKTRVPAGERGRETAHDRRFNSR